MPSTMGSLHPVIISDSEPTIDPQAVMVDNDQWRWLNTANGRMYSYTDSGWERIGGGLTGSRTIGGFTLTFTDGLLTGFEAV